MSLQCREHLEPRAPGDTMEQQEPRENVETLDPRDQRDQMESLETVDLLDHLDLQYVPNQTLITGHSYLNPCVFPQGPQGTPAAGILPPPPPVGRFYRGAPDEGQEVDIGSLDEIVELHRKLQAIKSPLGTHSSPARSCLDLYLLNKDIEDGLYWIDPNGGCPSDAIQVHCNFTNGVAKTCISPVSGEAERQPWSGSSIWFSNLNGGFKVKAIRGKQHAVATYYNCAVSLPHSWITTLPRPSLSLYVWALAQLPRLSPIAASIPPPQSSSALRTTRRSHRPRSSTMDAR